MRHPVERGAQSSGTRVGDESGLDDVTHGTVEHDERVLRVRGQDRVDAAPRHHRPDPLAGRPSAGGPTDEGGRDRRHQGADESGEDDEHQAAPDSSLGLASAKALRAWSRATPVRSGIQPVAMYCTRCPMFTAWSPMRS